MVKNALGFLNLIRTVRHQQAVFLFIPFSAHPDIREEAGLPPTYFLGDEVMRLHFVMGCAAQCPIERATAQSTRIDPLGRADRILIEVDSRPG